VAAVRWVVLALLGVLLWTAPAPAAAAPAGCATDPTPSPHRFTGVVTQLKDAGSLAVVRRDGGPLVTVRTGIGDRTDDPQRDFEVGARYEFHPRNASAPYADDPCTATRLLDRPPTSAERNSGGDLVTRLFYAAIILAATLYAPRLARRIRRRGKGGDAPQNPPTG